MNRGCRGACLPVAAAFVACALGAGRAAAQAEAPPGAAVRPRVALVLSGGGALGIAHIGVLRVLEEMQVPIDCVAGTSMGAIVGGLYAAGYSPAELESLVHELDWRAFLRDTPDRRRVPFRRKVDDLGYLSRWELGLSGEGIKTPSGMVAGHRLGVVLRLLGLRAAGIDDFDRLPLPFRAVAADVTTGETVVLAHGELASAQRASMAMPGLFSAVELDGRLLVDGGVVANLPVDAAREMGAEVVIAVDLGQPMGERERPRSLAGILGRTVGLLTRLNLEQALAGADVVVRPDVNGYGLLDFHAAPVLLERGLAAARAQAAALQPLSVDAVAWQRYLERQRRATPSIRVAMLAIDPGPGLAPAAVKHAVRTQPGRDLDPGTLRADLDRLWELGEYETVDFDLRPAEAGAYDLHITGHRKAWGPNYLRAGIGIYSDLEGTSSFNILGALTMTRLNRIGGELKAAAQIGERPLVSGELYQPVAASQRPFFALGVQGSFTKVQVPVANDLLQYRYVEQRVAFDLGYSLGRFGELRLGARHDSTRGRATGNSGGSAPHDDRTNAGFRANLILDQLDTVNFPHRGILVGAELYEARASLGADDEYRSLDLQVVTAATVGHHTLVGLVHGGSALGGTRPPQERVFLGGLFNLSGLPPGELAGSYGGVASLVYLYRVGRLPNFGEGIYAGISMEAGNAWESAAAVDLGDLRHSFALVVGADTLLGPIYLAHGRTTGGKDSFYLYVGRLF